MPLVDWLRYFHAVAPFATQEYLSSNPEILIGEIDFMKRISVLLLSTNPRIITNYVFSRYTSSWSGELGERYEDISQEFHRVMYGKEQKAPRWKYCTIMTMLLLKHATSAVYIRKVFDQAALEKADQMQHRVAYPNFILDDEKLDERYNGLDIRDSESYSDMLEKISRWNIEYSFRRLTKPVDRSEFHLGSTVVNAQYSSLNSIGDFEKVVK
ncbi:unnamed protein product [Strongylus vulgaris]|uniref:Peptidase M13 N-terminal domain-containing protein n=1 Tax=Strongylus vulgaris TaxID=40348 RepID=A0A3P7KBJ9_STRVU|nr:unnamed protein product [Strongylus vulgaris]